MAKTQETVKPSTTQPAGPGPAEVLVVSSTQPGGRRRAGRSFGPEPVTLPLTELTGAEVDALLTDPGLSVRRI